MTNKEAIKKMRNIDANLKSAVEAINLAIAALGKQTGKRPKPSGVKDIVACPNCRRTANRREEAHGDVDIPYCKWCGQALAWDESAGEV